MKWHEYVQEDRIVKLLCCCLLTLHKDIDSTCCWPEISIPNEVLIMSIVWSIHMKECQRRSTVWYNHLYMVWEFCSDGQAAAIFQCYGSARTYRRESWISKGAINVVSPTKSYVVPFINTWRIRWLFSERWYSVCDGIKYETICQPSYPQKVKSNMFILQRKRNFTYSMKKYKQIPRRWKRDKGWKHRNFLSVNKLINAEKRFHELATRKWMIILRCTLGYKRVGEDD